MIRYALLLSILAHFILIAGLSGPNINADKAFEGYTSSSDLSRVLQVRLSGVKQVQVERFAVKVVNPVTTKNDVGQQVAVGTQEKVARSASKRKSGENKLPLLMAGMVEVASLKEGDVSFDSYLKSTDVDISAIPLRELRLNNDPPISLMAITWHLRVFIDKNGEVRQVVNLDEEQAALTDYREVITRVEQMQFIPAKKNGVVVNSYIDVAIEISK